MRNIGLSLLAGAAFLLIGVLTAEANGCGAPKAPKTPNGICLKNNGATWGRNPANGRCQWFTTSSAIRTRCGV